jgi:DNA adenine methylase
MENLKVKPFLKWVGGKSQLLNSIRSKYPIEVNSYCEPFVGGGAVLLDIIATKHPKSVLINDINSELINAYVQVQSNVNAVINELSKLQTEYWQLSTDERKEYYLTKREQFNRIKSTTGNQLQESVLFIFLNKTCFNGLYRVNKKGLFNVPVGAYKQPLICDEGNLMAVSRLLQGVTIQCGDFSQCLDFIQQDTFVYLDPPYRPLSETSSFTAYNNQPFNDNEQIRLSQFIDKTTGLGAKIVLSNSDPKNSNVNDNFFDTLYNAYTIQRVFAKRMVNCKGSSRGNVSELLISNY